MANPWSTGYGTYGTYGTTDATGPLYDADSTLTALEPVPPAEPVAGSGAELDARQISAWFGDRKVLDRVSLAMPATQVTALIGPSGCGKSTFLRILNRMHELVPAAKLAGEVRLDGDDIYEPGRRLTDARRPIGMVFQKPNPFPAMTIYDNVVAGLKLTGMHASASAQGRPGRGVPDPRRAVEGGAGPAAPARRRAVRRPAAAAVHRALARGSAARCC